MTPAPQTQSATRLNRLSAGATKHSAELQNLLLPNGTGPGSRTQGRTSTALTVATDDRPETTAGSKLSPARHPVPGDGRGPKLQTAGFMAVPFFNVGIIHLRVLPAPPDLFPPFTPAGKIQPQSPKKLRVGRDETNNALVRLSRPRNRGAYSIRIGIVGIPAGQVTGKYLDAAEKAAVVSKRVVTGLSSFSPDVAPQQPGATGIPAPAALDSPAGKPAESVPLETCGEGPRRRLRRSGDGTHEAGYHSSPEAGQNVQNHSKHVNEF